MIDGRLFHAVVGLQIGGLNPIGLRTIGQLLKNLIRYRDRVASLVGLPVHTGQQHL